MTMLVTVYDRWKANAAVALCANIAITGVDTFQAGKHVHGMVVLYKGLAWGPE